MLSKIQDWLLDIADKVDSNIFLTSLKNAFITFVPFITAGSMASLFNTLLCNTQVGLAHFIPALNAISPAFTAINFATISIMSLPITYLFAGNLAKAHKIPEKYASILALACYIAVVPQTVSITVDGVAQSAAGIGSAPLGAQGLFIGMFIAWLSEKIYCLLYKIDAIKIKMPDSVPSNIAASFNNLIPLALTLIGVSTFGMIFRLITGQYMNTWIYSAIQRPVELLFQTPAGVIGLMMICVLFWFLGVHGGMTIFSIRSPLCAAALATNIALVDAGQAPTEVFTNAFYVRISTCGAIGCLFSLCIALLLFSKREDQRTVAKLGIVPALFGISEPMIFGLPMVLNMTYVIPFVASTGMATAVGLIAHAIGFLTPSTVDAPASIPFFIGGLISYGWKGVVVQAIIVVLGIIMYMPFVKIANKEKLATAE